MSRANLGQLRRNQSSYAVINAADSAQNVPVCQTTIATTRYMCQQHKPHFCLAICRLLNKTDWFTQGKAAKTLTAILEARPDKEPFVLENGASNGPVVPQGVDHAMKTFIEWLCSQLRCLQCNTHNCHLSQSALLHHCH